MGEWKAMAPLLSLFPGMWFVVVGSSDRLAGWDILVGVGVLIMVFGISIGLREAQKNES